MTSPASLFANSTVPLSPAIGPSTLLPCHDQTTFQLSSACSTPGIELVGGSTGNRERLRRILAAGERSFVARVLPRLLMGAAIECPRRTLVARVLVAFRP